MALFGLFGKKNDVQKEIERIEREKQRDNQKMCAACGRTYSLETEECPECNLRLYVESENFCMNPECERNITKHSFDYDDFICDKCKMPTVVGDIHGFNDPQE